MESLGDIASELAKLQELTGSEFIVQLKRITNHNGFHPIETDPNIFTMGGEQDDDYENLLSAARKAVELGYTVYILPNPRGIRTADFIFVRKGVYKMYDLKTIQGKGSAGTQLKDSIGQTNRVLLHIKSEYNGMALARSIKKYFEINPKALEVLVFKGKKVLTVKRISLQDKDFLNTFRMRYSK